MSEPRQIAALYVETAGAYFGVHGVDPWDEQRDARKYAGPHPVVAHPPCQRWGRFWHGSTRKPHQFQLGADDGCFKAALAALAALAAHGGVLEHPADSHAWAAFGINKPLRLGGWVHAGLAENSWTCCVYQGHYGHLAGKPTWLLAIGVPFEQLPALRWGKVEQRIHPVALAKHGYEKARRIGMMAMVGGKDKTRIRNGTPPEFRAELIAIARSVNMNTPKGDQPRFERGREVMEPSVCESAAGRGTNGAPALATLPHYGSPVGGPMGLEQPAAAGLTMEAA